MESLLRRTSGEEASARDGLSNYSILKVKEHDIDLTEGNKKLIPDFTVRMLAQAVPNILKGGGLFYIFLTAVHALVLSGTFRIIMVVISACTSLYCFACWFLTRKVKQPRISLNLLTSGMFLVVLNSFVHLWLSHDILQSTNLMIALIGQGLIIFDFLHWCFISVSCFAAFLIPVFVFNLPDAFHFGIGMVFCLVISFIGNRFHKRLMTLIVPLLLKNQQQRAELEQALEEMSAAREKADLNAKAQGDFLANMSHEIRTPLNGIIGMTNLLLDLETLDDEQTEMVECTRVCGEHLLMLINDILDLTRLDEGGVSLECIPVTLAVFVQQTLDIFSGSHVLKPDDVVFELQLDPSLPTTIWGDSNRIRQILINLLNNAFKFTKKGFVRLHTEMLASKDGAAGELLFRVEDSGIGISPEQLGQLFQRFNQLGAATTRTYGGSGLGLNISQKLAQLMGGRIDVTSKGVGFGSTFTLVIPADKKLLQGDANSAANAPQPLPHLTLSAPQASADAAVKPLVDALSVSVRSGTNKLLHMPGSRASFQFSLVGSNSVAPREGEEYKDGETKFNGSSLRKSSLKSGSPSIMRPQRSSVPRSTQPSSNNSLINIDLSTQAFDASSSGPRSPSPQLQRRDQESLILDGPDEIANKDNRDFQQQSQPPEYQSPRTPQQPPPEHLCPRPTNAAINSPRQQAVEYQSPRSPSPSNSSTGKSGLTLPGLVSYERDRADSPSELKMTPLRSPADMEDPSPDNSIHRRVTSTFSQMRLNASPPSAASFDSAANQKSPVNRKRRKKKGMQLSKPIDRLLLIEDNAVNQKVAIRMLSNMGVQVDLAKDGLEAVEMCKAKPYPILLMDILMPRLDGYGATTAILGLPSETKPYVIALSANVLQTEVDKCYACGMRDVCAKPLKEDQLFQVLEKALAKLEEEGVLPIPASPNSSPQALLPSSTPSSIASPSASPGSVAATLQTDSAPSTPSIISNAIPTSPTTPATPITSATSSSASPAASTTTISMNINANATTITGAATPGTPRGNSRAGTPSATVTSVAFPAQPTGSMTPPMTIHNPTPVSGTRQSRNSSHRLGEPFLNPTSLSAFLTQLQERLGTFLTHRSHPAPKRGCVRFSPSLHKGLCTFLNLQLSKPIAERTVNLLNQLQKGL
eukprot:g14198.t1